MIVNPYFMWIAHKFIFNEETGISDTVGELPKECGHQDPVGCCLLHTRRLDRRQRPMISRMSNSSKTMFQHGGRICRDWLLS